ncbi:MAG: hypothetical protein US68_C0041G0001 [Candidatus Shapirobacteria bacterium GW2011_GWE1_38_10]|uniref:Uncharacterized protein n=1 Tax=Candidatus Shapirobacteria bacterium GW2011_GWE1_38_10 TaxID=1618488 RepID=A0A0G0HYS7_9BACT|nr:MAG: hypothetical protein US68_C0041G0001 [Candidatus Shapirobacteria bacterium GW2011_GWE1_38_10]
MKLAFIIVNFHSDQDSLNIIKDILENDPVKDVEVVIYADDNSRSNEFKTAVEKFKQVIYIDSPEGNVGFAGGNNLGIKRALGDGADIICLINNDTLAPKDLVKNILISPISDPQVGIVGGLIYFAKGFEFKDKYSAEEKGKVIWYAGGKLDWNNVLGSHLGVDEVDRGQYDGVKDTDFVTGCLLIARSQIYKKVGLLDERYYLYNEDVDFNLRVRKAGFRTVVDPSIKIWHKVAQSSGIGSELNDYFITRNRLLLGFTYARLRTKVALLREAIRKLSTGTKTQKLAIKDFFARNLGKGSFLK